MLVYGEHISSFIQYWQKWEGTGWKSLLLCPWKQRSDRERTFVIVYVCVFETKDTVLSMHLCALIEDDRVGPPLHCSLFLRLISICFDHQVKQVSRKVYTYDILPEFTEGLRQQFSTPFSEHFQTCITCGYASIQVMKSAKDEYQPKQCTEAWKCAHTHTHAHINASL